MTGSVNYQDSIRLSEGLEAVVDEFNQWLFTFLLIQADEFLRRVKLRTPVDKGLLQKSWKLNKIGWRGDTLEAEFINDANDGWASYATFVEYGHAKPYLGEATRPHESTDWVMGAFMLTYTVRELEKEMPVELQNSFAKFLKKHGVG